MKNILKLNFLAILFMSIQHINADQIAVIDMRAAVLSTQAASDAFKALEEDPDYASNLEEAQGLQAERQELAEKLQKDLETLSNEDIAKCKRNTRTWQRYRISCRKINKLKRNRPKSFCY